MLPTPIGIMDAAMTAGPSHFSLRSASWLMQPSIVLMALSKEGESRALMSDLKLLLIVTVHFMTFPISLNVGRPAFFSPLSRTSPAFAIAAPTFLMSFKGPFLDLEDLELEAEAAAAAAPFATFFTTETTARPCWIWSRITVYLATALEAMAHT